MAPETVAVFLPFPRGTPDVARIYQSREQRAVGETPDRIEDQVRGIKRMVVREAHCIDILIQITSINAASEKVASILMQDHLDHCVREAIENEDETDEKPAEFKAALERFLRI